MAVAFTMRVWRGINTTFTIIVIIHRLNISYLVSCYTCQLYRYLVTAELLLLKRLLYLNIILLFEIQDHVINTIVLYMLSDISKIVTFFYILLNFLFL